MAGRGRRASRRLGGDCGSVVRGAYGARGPGRYARALSRDSRPLLRARRELQDDRRGPGSAGRNDRQQDLPLPRPTPGAAGGKKRGRPSVWWEMTAFGEEQLARLIRALPPAPQGGVRAAQELPLARAELDAIVARAEADAAFRAQPI